MIIKYLDCRICKNVMHLRRILRNITLQEWLRTCEMDKSGSQYDQLISSSLERGWAADSKVNRLTQNTECLATA